jgi:voltage-gated potassium channel
LGGDKEETVSDIPTSKVVKKLAAAVGIMVFMGTLGTTAYWFIGEGRYSLLDCLYMTFITISTIGYGEIIDLSASPAGRIFTMALAASGVGVMTYILVNVTAFVVEGELNETFRRKKMEKAVEALEGHYIVCGLDGVGAYVLEELRSTDRPHVLVDDNREELDRYREEGRELLFLEGDPTDSDTLRKAGAGRASGLFAVTDDDNRNLVISLTARQLNPALKVIARCEIMKNAEKMRSAGADAIVSPTFIGGLRMASEMLRPSVVSFLDEMLRSDDASLRIEEQVVPDSFVGRPMSDLDLGRFRHLLLLAVKTSTGWVHNPPRSHVMDKGETLIFMTSPEERQELEKIFSSF